MKTIRNSIQNKINKQLENQKMVAQLREMSGGVNQGYCVKNGANSAVSCNDCGIRNNPKLLFTTLYNGNFKGLLGCEAYHYCESCIIKNGKKFAIIRKHRKRVFDTQYQLQRRMA